MKYKNKANKFIKVFKRDYQLHLLILIPLVYVIIFNYGPMYGLQIAFRDYRPGGGVTGSTWVGLQWFLKFLKDPEFIGVLVNTMAVSLYSLATFPLPVVFALILNALQSEKFKKVVQTISYMPHFISVTVLVGIMNMIFSPVNGIYGNIFHLLGGTGYPVDFRGISDTFRHMYVWSGVWQNIGWNSIIYIAALSGVSSELHEAAQIDGATRLKRMIYVDIPSILPTICIMFILRCSDIISVGFEKVYLMQSGINLDVSEVISTYVYKTGMSSFRNFSYGSAIGLFNTVVNLTMVILVNTITKKLSDNEVSFF